MIAIQTQNLTRKFGDFIAVNNVSLELQQGGVYGFLGPNGSGKSTTIRMLAGLLLPTSGSGKILGFDILTQSERIKEQIGYVSQKFSLYDDLTVYENMDFYAGLYSIPIAKRKERISEVIHMVELAEFEHAMVSSISGGIRQKLALGCAILHKPKLLFLDEATSGADPNTRRLFWQLIYKFSTLGTTILVTTHFLDEAEHCDNISFIKDGVLIANDTPKALKASIPGTIYKIESTDPVALLQHLEDQHLPLLDAYIFGRSVRVRLQPQHVDCLAEYTLIPAVASLEDAFIYLVQQQFLEQRSE